MAAAENSITDFRSFKQAFGAFPGTENWFYVDDRTVGFQQSGYYPRHARGTDVDLPHNGDGAGDWQGFDPATYTYRFIPMSHRPEADSSTQPIIISWNQKEARGWRKGPTEWTDGSVHHSELLYHRLLDQMRAGGGKVDLTGLTRAVNLAATEDLRGDEVYAWMRRLIGRPPADLAPLVALLDAWHASGSHRLDADGDNLYEHGAAVALFDQWWPRFVRAQFQPVLGTSLFDALSSSFLHLGTTTDQDWGWSWSSNVEKDLRQVLGRRVRGPHSRRYCGGGRRARCRAILLGTLRAAAAATAAKYGSSDPAAWKVPATCPRTSPPSCDQEIPTDLGAVDTPPFPWQNRGTYHQVVELTQHR
jgi:hypothetical protein